MVCSQRNELRHFAQVKRTQVVARTIKVAQVWTVGEVDVIELHIGVNRTRSMLNVEFVQLGVFADV